MVATDCLECGGAVAFGEDVLLGEIAQCPECGVELEVLRQNPLEIGLAPQVEEDWGE
jgi:alpha-aminoadipate carrier protein LysW